MISGRELTVDEVALLGGAILENAELASLHITCESIGEVYTA